MIAVYEPLFWALWVMALYGAVSAFIDVWNWAVEP